MLWLFRDASIFSFYFGRVLGDTWWWFGTWYSRTTLTGTWGATQGHPSVFICPFLVWRQQYLWRMEDRWTNWWCKSNMAVQRLQALLCAMIRVMMKMDKVLSFSLQSNPSNTVPCELTEARKQVQFTRRVSYLGLCSQGVASVTWLLLLLDVKGEITGMGWVGAVQQK